MSSNITINRICQHCGMELGLKPPLPNSVVTVVPSIITKQGRKLKR